MKKKWAKKKEAASLTARSKPKPRTWAEFMKQCHERPLPREAVDEAAKSYKPPSGPASPTEPA